VNSGVFIQKVPRTRKQEVEFLRSFVVISYDEKSCLSAGNIYGIYYMVYQNIVKL
jgi:hypothetical protein